MGNVFTVGRSLGSLKAAFFDRAKVRGAVDKAKVRVLSKFGAFVRRRAQTSIRPRKVSSPAGSPPSSHTGILRKLLFFARDESNGSVVVGPAVFTSAKVRGTPGRLERGGLGTAKGRAGKFAAKFYKPRPFMRPALHAEQPKFADLFKNAVSAAGAR